jgi:transposase InsO family protein
VGFAARVERALAVLDNHSNTNDCLADTGCTLSMFTNKMRRYVVSEWQERREWQLAMTNGEAVVTETMCEFHLPVKCKNGNIKIAKEIGVCDNRVPMNLLACAERDLHLTKHNRWVLMTTVTGDKIRVNVPLIDRVPLLSIFESDEVTRASGCVDTTESAFFAECKVSLAKGGVSTAKLTEKQKASRQRVLYVLHVRLSHALGERLRLTLREKGINNFTATECKDVKRVCKACRECNQVKHKIPRVVIPKFNKFNECLYHDFIELPCVGFGGKKYGSVIIDAASRYVSVWATRGMTSLEAAQHLVSWSRKFERMGFGKPKKITARKKQLPANEVVSGSDKSQKKIEVREKELTENELTLKQKADAVQLDAFTLPQVVKVDNGPCFIGETYRQACTRLVIQLDYGSPYTPESQAVVERVNKTIKACLKKVLISVNLPGLVWPAIMPGCVNMINDCVSAATGVSPRLAAFGIALPLMPIATGDSVSISDPVPRQKKSFNPPGLTGIFAGILSPSCVNILFKRHGHWTSIRVHPTRVTLCAWAGVSDLSMLQLNEQQKLSEEDSSDLIQRQRLSHDFVVPIDDLFIDEFDEDANISGASEDTLRHNCVLMRNVDGSVFPAQIITEGKKSLQIAKLQRQKLDTGKWTYDHIIWHQSKDNIDMRFDWDPEGPLPDRVLSLIGDENVVEEIKPTEQVVDLQDDVDDDDACSDISAITSYDGSNDVDGDEPVVQVDYDDMINYDSEERLETALTAKSLGTGTENEAKNQIDATREEIKSGSHDRSMVNELASWETHKVMYKETGTHKRPLRTRWVHTWKNKKYLSPELNKIQLERVEKSRLVAVGCMENGKQLDTYSGTADVSVLRLCLLFALSHGWKGATTDVRTAFLQAPITRDCWIQMPSNTPPHILKRFNLDLVSVYKLSQNVYGTKDAPRVYTKHFKSKVELIGWEELTESVLVRRVNNVIVAILIMHVDDLMCLCDNPVNGLSEIGKIFNIDEPENMCDDDPHIYTGVSIKWTEEAISIDLCKYSKQCRPQLTDAERKKKFSQAEFELSEDVSAAVSETDSSDTSLSKQYQSYIGQLGWIVRVDKAYSYSFSQLSTFNTSPSAKRMTLVKRVLNHAADNNSPLVFNKVNVPALAVWTDGAYKLATYTGRCAYLIQVVDDTHVFKGPEMPDNNYITWKSHKCKRKLASSTSSELIAMCMAIKCLYTYVRMIRDLWQVHPRIVIYTDSMILYNQLKSGKCVLEPRMQGCLEYVIECRDEIRAEVVWVPDKQQRADPLTKCQLH